LGAVIVSFLRIPMNRYSDDDSAQCADLPMLVSLCLSAEQNLLLVK